MQCFYMFEFANNPFVDEGDWVGAFREIGECSMEEYTFYGEEFCVVMGGEWTIGGNFTKLNILF